MADRTVTALFNVRFDTAALQRGQAMIRSVTKSLKVLAGAAGVGFAIKGLSDFTHSMTTTFDTMSKGARTVNFSRQAFQEWLTTIQLAGGSERSFAKYVFFMQRGIGEAAAGLQTYAEAFQALGLAPRALQKLSPEKQFEKVFNALGDLTDQTERNRLAQRILGRGGRELTVAMKEQLGTHAKNREELHRLGAVIKDEILIRSEQFRDRVVWLEKAMQGFKARALDKILDVAEPVVDFFKETWREMNELADTTYMLEAALLALKGTVILLAGYILWVTWPILLVGAALLGLFLILESVYTAMQGGKSKVAEWYKSWTDGRDLVEDIESLREELKRLKEGLEDFYASVKKDPPNELKQWFDDVADSVEYLLKLIDGMEDSWLLSQLKNIITAPFKAYDVAGDVGVEGFKILRDMGRNPQSEYRPMPSTSPDDRVGNVWNVNVNMQPTGNPTVDGRRAGKAVVDEASRQAAGSFAPLGVGVP